MLRKKSTYLIIFSFLLTFGLLSWQPQVGDTSLPQGTIDLGLHWENNTAHVNELLFKILPGVQTQLDSLIKGDVDVISQFINPNWINDTILNDSNITISTTRRAGFGHVSFNTATWPTDQRGLRRALAFAIDKYAISEIAYNNYSRPIDTPLTPSVGIWSIEHENSSRQLVGSYYLPDPLRGNHSLLLDGFYDIDQDGWREWFNATRAGISWKETVNASKFTPDSKNPDPIVASEAGLNPSSFDVLNNTIFSDLTSWDEVKVTILGTSGSTIASTVLAQSTLAYHSVGINATAQHVSFANLITRLDNGDFEAAFFGFTTRSGPGFLEALRTNSSTNAGIWRWSNATYDELLDVIATSPFFSEALNASLDAQEILWYEQPLVVMYNNLLISVYRVDKFKGWVQPLGGKVASEWSPLKVHLTDLNGTPISGGQLRIALEHSMSSQNPLNTADATDLEVLGYIYDTLWKRDPYTLQPIPWLAKDWDIQFVNKTTGEPLTGNLSNINPSQIAQKIIFYLNSNFKWHDGYPVLPEDVAFSYQLYVNTNSPTFIGLTTMGGGSVNTSRITYNNSEMSVTFILESSSSLRFEDTGGWIFPKHIWEPLLQQMGNSSTLYYSNDNPIGSGPYKWKSRVSGDYILLERNLDWPFRPDSGNQTTGTTTTTSTLTTTTFTTTQSTQPNTTTTMTTPTTSIPPTTTTEQPTTTTTTEPTSGNETSSEEDTDNTTTTTTSSKQGPPPPSTVTTSSFETSMILTVLILNVLWYWNSRRTKIG